MRQIILPSLYFIPATVLFSYIEEEMRNDQMKKKD